MALDEVSAAIPRDAVARNVAPHGRAAPRAYRGGASSMIHFGAQRFSLGMLLVKNQETNPGIPISLSLPIQNFCIAWGVSISGDVNAPST